MDTKLFARAGAIALAAVAITLAVIQMREPSRTAPDAVVAEAEAGPVDPLRAELRRCQAIGSDAAGDRACIRAWAENRRRFLAPGARPMERLDQPDADADEAAIAGDAAGDNPVVKQLAPADQVDD